MNTHFERPQSVDQALALRDKYGQAACWAGGCAIAGRDARRPIDCVISLEDIRVDGEGLGSIRHHGDHVRIGAMTCLQDICDNAFVPDVLRAAAAFQPSRALRCMTTLGDDVAARKDDGCLPVVLTALGSVLELAGDASITADTYRLRHARDLILFANVPLERQCAVARHARSARGAVIVTAAVGWNQDKSHVVVALNGAGQVLHRLPQIEDLVAQGLRGTALEKAVLAVLAPQAHWTGSVAFRAHLTAVAIADSVDACHEGRVLAC